MILHTATLYIVVQRKFRPSADQRLVWAQHGVGHVCVFLILFHDDGDGVGDDDDDALSPCSVYVSPSPACVYVFTGRQAADRSAGHWVSSICHLHLSPPGGILTMWPNFTLHGSLTSTPTPAFAPRSLQFDLASLLVGRWYCIKNI